MKPRITASTPIDQWPEFLTPRELALGLGRSYRTVQAQLTRGTMWPPPISAKDGSFQKPYTFSRDTIARFKANALPRSPHRARRSDAA